NSATDGNSAPTVNKSAAGSHKHTTAIIIGSVVGGIVTILALLTLLYLIRRCRRRPPRSFYSLSFRRFNRRRHQSFGVTALPLPDSPLLRPIPFTVHRKSPRTVGESQPTETSPLPTRMGEGKERIPEGRADTGAAETQQSDGQTYQNSTDAGRQEPNEQSRDPEIMAQLHIVVQRLAQLEARFDEEVAPPDYTSNRS
ncbi:hypothetical protein V5O48_014375, partial [Marasmius crinis-equi]